MAHGQASGAVGGSVCEVELLEAATQSAWVPPASGHAGRHVMQPKGAVVITSLDKLTVDK